MQDSVFQQLLKPVTQNLLSKCVEECGSDYDYETFKTKEHLKAMVYCHLNEIKSLRTLEVAINSQKIGIRTKIKRSTLSDANTKRSADCFLMILEKLLTLLPRKKRKTMGKQLRLLDSTLIQLRGEGFDSWAKKTATGRCQGLKLHVEYDAELESLLKAKISEPNVNDCSMGARWPIESETIYVFDKGYCDYNWWWKIHKRGSFFVTRLKHKTAMINESKSRKTTGNILHDGVFNFKNKRLDARKKNLYTEHLRIIKVKREADAPLVLVTNLHDEPAEVVADLYKTRWEIELFFKWIKQNLKIKKFIGRSKNAVKIQLATALIAYVLLQIFKIVTNSKSSLHLLLVWVRCNLQTRKNFIIRDLPPNEICLRFARKAI